MLIAQIMTTRNTLTPDKKFPFTWSPRVLRAARIATVVFIPLCVVEVVVAGIFVGPQLQPAPGGPSSSPIAARRLHAWLGGDTLLTDPVTDAPT